MRAVDTNVLVRLIVRDDARQVASAEEFIERGAWASLLVIAETIWVLRVVYEHDHEEIAAALDMLLDHSMLAVQDAEVVAAALETYRHKPAL